MKTLILDYKKWRCGGLYYTFLDYKENGLGDCKTRLYNPITENSHNYCCLGIFSSQLNPSIKRKDLVDRAYPCSLGCHIPLLTKGSDNIGYMDTGFSVKAVEINDDKNTTVPEKMKALRSLCSKYHYKLEFKNFPKKYMKEL